MATDFLPRDKELNSYSRKLRNNGTKQEKHLWYDFLSKQSARFYRQRIIGEYIVDFFCPSAKLVIEIDGAQHYEEEALKYDKQRTEFLEELGLTVIRFTNIDVDRHFESVCAVIEQTMTKRLAEKNS